MRCRELMGMLKDTELEQVAAAQNSRTADKFGGWRWMRQSEMLERNTVNEVW